MSADHKTDKMFDIINKIKTLMWGSGGCDGDCNDCPMYVDKDDYAPEVCFIKALRHVFDPDFMTKKDYTEVE